MTPKTRDFLYRGPLGPQVVIELADDEEPDELYLSGPPSERAGLPDPSNPLFRSKTMKNYCARVPDSLENTGLDSAVFASRYEAEAALAVLLEVYPTAIAEVTKTEKPANTTFAAWDESGW